MAIDGNNRKLLYRKLLTDPATQKETSRFSFNEWERKLSTDAEAIGRLGEFAVKKGWVKSLGDYADNYISGLGDIAAPAPSVPTPARPAQEAKTAAPVEEKVTPLERTRQLARQGGLGVVAVPPAERVPSITDITRQQVAPPVQPIGVLAPEPMEETPSLTEITREQVVTPAPKVEKETLRGRLQKEGKQLISGIVDYGKGLYTQAKRGIAQGEAIQSVNMGDLREAAQGKDAGKINYDLLAKANKAVKEYGQTSTDVDLAKKEGFIKDAWDLVKALPGVTIESLASLGRSGIEEVAVGTGIGAGAGSVVPIAGTAVGAGIGATAGMIQAGRNMEYFGSLMQELEAKGVDITDPVQLREGLKRYGKEADDLAITRANVIAGVETLIPVAGKVLSKLGGRVGREAIRKPLQKAGQALTYEPIAGPLGGATGELSAQVASGQEISPQEIFLEAGGEGAATVAAVTKALKDKTAAPAGTPPAPKLTLPDGSVRITVNSIDEIPEQYRDRAKKTLEGTASSLPFGLGRKTKVEQWQYTLSPEEAQYMDVQDVEYEPVSETETETAPVTEYVAVTPEEMTAYYEGGLGALSEERQNGINDDLQAIAEGRLTIEELEAEDENYADILQNEIDLFAEERERVLEEERQREAAPAAEEVPAEPVGPEAAPEVVSAAPVEEARIEGEGKKPAAEKKPIQAIPKPIKLTGLNNSAYNGLDNDNRSALGFLQQYPENFIGIEDLGSGAEKITGITNKNTAKIEKVNANSLQLNFKNDRTKVLHFTSEEAKDKAVDEIYKYVSSRIAGEEEVAVPVEEAVAPAEPAPKGKAPAVPETGKEVSNVKVSEGKGGWRVSFNETQDVARKNSILEEVASRTTDKNELRDVYEAAKQTEKETNRVNWAIANNKNTPQDVFDDLIKSKALERTVSDEAIKSIIDKRAEPAPETVAAPTKPSAPTGTERAARKIEQPKSVKEIIKQAVQAQSEYDAFWKKNKKYLKDGKIADAMPEALRKEGKELLAKITLIQGQLNDVFAKASAESKEQNKAQTALINKEFQERQKELEKAYGLTKEEAIEATITEKLEFQEPLTTDEVEWANENMYRPVGYQFDENGLTPSAPTGTEGKKAEAGTERGTGGETRIKAIADKLEAKQKLTQEEQTFFDANRKKIVEEIGSRAIAKSKPTATKKSEEPSSESFSVQKALDRYNEEEGYTVFDFVKEIEENSEDPALLEAVKKYREEEAYDKSVSGRGDMDKAESDFVKAVEASQDNKSSILTPLRTEPAPVAEKEQGKKAAPPTKTEPGTETETEREFKQAIKRREAVISLKDKANELRNKLADKHPQFLAENENLDGYQNIKEFRKRWEKYYLSSGVSRSDISKAKKDGTFEKWVREEWKHRNGVYPEEISDQVQNRYNDLEAFTTKAYEAAKNFKKLSEAELEEITKEYEALLEKSPSIEGQSERGRESPQPSAPSFTSSQSSEAATDFDKAKTSKGFDKKHGKGAYKALSDITKNFEDIMDKVSDKIKQDCIL